MIESGTTMVRVQADIALQAEVQPRRDQHQLGRNARAVVVADLAQQRQVEPREAVAGWAPPASRIACRARAIAGSSGETPVSLRAK